jgi:hypothetical protein
MADPEVSNAGLPSVEVMEKWYDWAQAASQRAIPFADLVGLRDPRIAIQREINSMILQLKAYVTSEHLEPQTFTDTKKVGIYVPATWWDFFKFTYQDRWWMKKFFQRPKYELVTREVTLSVEVTPQIIYPEANLPVPSVMGRPFKTYTARVVDDDDD